MGSDKLKEISKRAKRRRGDENVEKRCPSCGEPAEVLKSKYTNYLCRNDFCTIIVF